MNQYQAKLEPNLFQCSLGLEDNTQLDRPVKYVRLNRDKLHQTAKENPHMRIISGSVNGFYIHELAGMDLRLKPIAYLDGILDDLLNQNKLVPELYLVGGYYPRKDGLQVFEAQCHSNRTIYVWACQPWTDMPVYHITDDMLIRVKSGDIPSPKTVKIQKDMHDAIIDALTTRGPFVNYSNLKR